MGSGEGGVTEWDSSTKTICHLQVSGISRHVVMVCGDDLMAIEILQGNRI